jgi:hypothetical protein
LEDKVKVPFDSKNSIAELLGCDIYNAVIDSDRTRHATSIGELDPSNPISTWYSQHPDSFVSKLRQAGEQRFLVIIHWRFAPQGYASIYAMPPNRDEWPQVFKDFISGGSGKERDVERNKRFKIIPCVVDGPWVLRKAVGANPAIVGRELRTEYLVSEEENYLEVSCDVFTSWLAKRILGLCLGAAKGLVIEVGVLIEAQTTEELPEQLLGVSRVIFPDTSRARKLRV